MSSPCSADWILVPENWTTSEPGYFGTLQDGRDTLAAIQTYRETGERWKAAYSDLRTEFLTTTEDIKKQMTALEEQFNGERKAWKTEFAKTQRNNFWGDFLKIFFSGVIGYAAGN